jgi:TRAP-type uncharacterized transport system fused permease subunit
MKRTACVAVIGVLAVLGSTLVPAFAQSTLSKYVRFASLSVGVSAYVSLIFIYQPGLLLKGGLLDIIRPILLTLMIMTAFVHGATGVNFFDTLRWRKRVLFLVSGLVLIIPDSRAVLERFVSVHVHLPLRETVATVCPLQVDEPIHRRISCHL